MAILPILSVLDPRMRQRADEVTSFDEALRAFIADFTETLRHVQALGLSAVHLGVHQRIILIQNEDVNDDIVEVMINPEITATGEEIAPFREASVSMPGQDAEIRRPTTCTISYQDADGHKHETTCEGLRARVVLHEIEQLDGKIFIDNLSKLKRQNLLNKHRKLIRLGQMPNYLELPRG